MASGCTCTCEWAGGGAACGCMWLPALRVARRGADGGRPSPCPLLPRGPGDINPYDVGGACFFPRAAPAAGSAAPGAGGSGDAGGRRAWPWAARHERGAVLGNWWAPTPGAARRGDGGGDGSAGSSGSSSGSGGSGGDAMLRHSIACADRRAALAYYNDPDVRRAINAAPAKVAGR